MTLPSLTEPENLAVFLDFDGTLVEIAERPDAVAVAEETRTALGRLQTALGGALAIVTGREIEVIDAMLLPFRCPVAGIHGLTRRDAAGRAHATAVGEELVAHALGALAPLLASEPGLLLERKSHAIALHYRARPDLEGVVLATMEKIADAVPETRVVRGKMVVEARPGGGDKGTAVADFLAEPPFLGRTPVFAGDDETDEDAFRLVNARGGFSVKIGGGVTSATFRAESTAAFLAWLVATAERLEKGASIG
ncbi:MAG: trehalose-phosphatase [Hyphomicrobiaceae bacterium]